MPECRRPFVVACGVAFALATVGCGSAIDRGAALYKTHGCAGCHGVAGASDGPQASRLGTPPRDLRNARAFLNGGDADAIASTLAAGIRGRMPAYSHLTDAERRLLAAFVISLGEQQRKEDP